MSDRCESGQTDLQFLDALNGTGDLYLIRQTTTGRMLTGRRVNAQQASVYYLLQEIRVPHAPRIYDLRPEVDGQALVLEEYLPGLSLDRHLEQGCYTVQEAVPIVLQLCEALAVLHEAGLVHRDVKPENIIVTEDGQAYLIDYDIARVHREFQTHDTMMLGTMGYAAPEQYGFIQTDARADIYALGVLLNQMVTGAFPQDHMAPAPLDQIVGKCTALDPDNRYQTAQELERALGQALHCINKETAGEQEAPAEYRNKDGRKQGLPGFRSRNLWHMLLAIPCYGVALVLGSAILAASLESLLNFFIGIPLLGGCLATWLFVFDVLGLRSRCGLTEVHRGSRGYWGYCAVAVVLIWVAVLVVMVVDVCVLG